LVIVLVVAAVILLLRPLIQNLSSGLLLQLRGPFKPGDLVKTNEIIGVVEEVNTRTVVVATNDGTRVHIPSREVLESVLVNYSTVGRRRSAMTLRLPMGSDLTTTTARLEEAVAALDHVLDEPPPEVVVTDFEGNQLLVDVLFWHRPELWAARLARDRVGRIVVELLEASDLVLADPTLTVTTVGPAQSG
jgi:small-conductance mechanosensitive channel